MIPRECDNDDCDYDDQGKQIHVEGCEPAFPISQEWLDELLTTAAPEGSFLQMMQQAMTTEKT